MTDKCVLMQHGVSIRGKHIGVCCYNVPTHTKPSGYEIDPTGCSACIHQERNGIKSYRQGANEKYGLDHDHRLPILLDFTPNFNCNLTCKICDEHSSSSWAKLKQIKIHKNYNIPLTNFKSVLADIDLSNVREINFSGGEPFLNHSIIKYISSLENRIDFAKCNLRFSTNGTYQLTDKLSDFFLKFKLVNARFSIDDIENGFEYQRYPANWDQCQSNWNSFLEYMPHNVMPSINRTVSILNIRRLNLLDEWHNSYLQTRFSDSIELIDHFAFGKFSMVHLTPLLKEHVLLTGNARAQQYVRNAKTIDHATVLQNVIQQYDKIHDTNLKDFDPELYRIIFQ